jgi:rhodanese-related sulfurtransferase
MRKIKLLISMMLSAMLVSSCGAPESSSSGYRQISMDEAVKMMRDEKNYIILDARRPDEFAEGHIPGAINVPNEEIGTAEIVALPDKSQLILVYCRSGRRSKEAAEKLVALGYTNIVEFGGILDYHGEIEK